MTADLSLTVTSTPTDEEYAAVGEGLAAFNEAAVGPSGFAQLMVIVRDGSGAVVAGIYGYTHWGWLYVQRLWVSEGERGGGLAGQMLTAAEDEARLRGCHGAWIDTFNPVALRAYQRQGYSAFGALDNFPRGRTRTFLQKRL